jgi:hypothetical protein
MWQERNGLGRKEKRRNWLAAVDQNREALAGQTSSNLKNPNPGCRSAIFDFAVCMIPMPHNTQATLRFDFNQMNSQLNVD